MMESDRIHFEDVIAKMPEYLRELEDCEIIARRSNGTLSPKLTVERGIYVFYEGSRPMYVGRSDRIRARLSEHGRPSSDSNSASFAFNIARGEFFDDFKEEFFTEYEEALERELGTEEYLLKSLTLRLDAFDPSFTDRKTLQQIPAFISRFDRAKERVRNMTIRVVEIQDPIEQTIFEVYAHMKLGTPFNSFENH